MNARSAVLALIVASWAAAPAAAQPAAAENEGQTRTELHWICAALAANDPKPCAALEAPARERCRVYQNALPVLRAYAAHDPVFPTLCPAAARRAELGPAYERICRDWWSAGRDPWKLRAAVVAAFPAEEPSQEEVRHILQEMVLLTHACFEVADPVQRGVCLQFSEYRDAFAAKNAALCRGGLCRMMMGAGAAACDDYKFLPARRGP